MCFFMENILGDKIYQAKSEYIYIGVLYGGSLVVYFFAPKHANFIHLVYLDFSASKNISIL